MFFYGIYKKKPRCNVSGVALAAIHTTANNAVNKIFKKMCIYNPKKSGHRITTGTAYL